jgi:hypothetical protein
MSQEYCVPLKLPTLAIPVMRNYFICFANCRLSYRLTIIPTSWDTYAPTPVSWVILLRATKMQTHLLLPLAFRDTLTPGSAVTQAVQSHALYHQNSNALCKQFVLPENRPDKLLKPAKSAHNTSPFH